MRGDLRGRTPRQGPTPGPCPGSRSPRWWITRSKSTPSCRTVQKKLARGECAPAHFWKRRRNLCLSSFRGGGLLEGGKSVVDLLECPGSAHEWKRTARIYSSVPCTPSSLKCWLASVSGPRGSIRQCRTTPLLLRVPWNAPARKRAPSCGAPCLRERILKRRIVVAERNTLIYVRRIGRMRPCLWMGEPATSLKIMRAR